MRDNEIYMHHLVGNFFLNFTSNLSCFFKISAQREYVPLFFHDSFKTVYIMKKMNRSHNICRILCDKKAFIPNFFQYQ